MLTFDVPLDPVSAQNVDAYKMIKRFRSDDDDGLFGGGDRDVDSSRIGIESANYDPAANTVTLIPRRAFALRKSFTILQVKGRGDDAVRTADGDVIDGDGNRRPGGDLNLRFRALSRKTLSFREADGDRVRLRIDGPGRILYFLPIRGRSSPSLFLRETDPAASVLTGTVKQSRRGDGVADLAQLHGTSAAQVPLLSDPAFRIRSQMP